MIRSRWSTDSALDVTIRPPFDECANASTAPAISEASRRLIGPTSTPTDDATDWITANWPIQLVRAGSRTTAARVTPGAISLSSSTHLPLKLYSNWMKPVALPPGRDRLWTKPAPTGSATLTKTIGTVRVACINDPTLAVPAPTMTSGARATNSAAYLRLLSALPMPQR